MTTQPAANKPAETMNNAGFTKAMAAGRQNFSGVRFVDEINWPADTELTGYYYFDHAVFQHDLNIGDARLWGTLRLDHAVFQGKLQVFRSKIVYINAFQATFAGAAAFANGSWFNNLSLNGSHFQRQLWIEADIATKFCLDWVRSPKTYIDWDRVPFGIDESKASLGEIHLLPKNR